MRIEKLNRKYKEKSAGRPSEKKSQQLRKIRSQCPADPQRCKGKRKRSSLWLYSKKFDGVKLDASQILVTDAEIEEAYTEVGEELLGIIRKALVNIRTYHEKQMQYSWFDSKPDGTILGQKVTALQRVGVYVPGRKKRLIRLPY